MNPLTTVRGGHITLWAVQYEPSCKVDLWREYQAGDKTMGSSFAWVLIHRCFLFS